MVGKKSIRGLCLQEENVLRGLAKCTERTAHLLPTTINETLVCKVPSEMVKSFNHNWRKQKSNIKWTNLRAASPWFYAEGGPPTATLKSANYSTWMFASLCVDCASNSTENIFFSEGTFQVVDLWCIMQCFGPDVHHGLFWSKKPQNGILITTKVFRCPLNAEYTSIVLSESLII